MSARSRKQGGALFNIIRTILFVVGLVILFYAGWFATTELQSFGLFSKQVAVATTTPDTTQNTDANTATAPEGAVASSSVPSSTPANPYASTYSTGSEVVIDGNTIDVALSTTTASIDQGLQYQPTLGSTDGMLFIFHTPKIYQFWMPNMSFPLDMIWIGSDKTVVSITRDAPPLADPTKPVWFRPTAPAQYVLEVNANYAAEHNIQIGDSVQFVSIPQ